MVAVGRRQSRAAAGAVGGTSSSRQTGVYMATDGTTGRSVADWRGEAPGYADLIAALIIRPSRDAWESVRAAWLFQAADALDDAGYAADAEVARERAMRLVRDAIASVAGAELTGDREPRGRGRRGGGARWPCV